MTKKIFIFFSLLLFIGCGIVKKKTTYGKKRTVSVEADESDRSEADKERKPKVVVDEKTEQIIATALTFSGVRYKFGGTTRKGMDCSGLLYVSFKEHGIEFPRISYEMANEGRKIKVGKVRRGDLLFFKTRKRGKRINHVGLVVDVDGDDIKFIHSTSSRGVIVSSLRDGYWNYAFVKATRVL